MKLLVTLKDGSKKHVSDLKKIVFPGYEGIETVTSMLYLPEALITWSMTNQVTTI